MDCVLDALLYNWVSVNIKPSKRKNIIEQNVNPWSELNSNENKLEKCINSVYKSLYNIYPCEHLFSTTKIKNRIHNITENINQLRILNAIPLIPQRTPEWYALRTKLITASDFGDALGIEKFGKKNDTKGFFKKKCGFDEVVYDMTNPILQWGVMFEPVANDIYVHRTGLKVYEFGLIQHPIIECLGASPDGINSIGVMLEIKCPYKRKINESILEQYYYQIQGQLDACKLSECDFLEIDFCEYPDSDSFWEDFDNEFEKYTHDEFHEKGIIIQTYDFQNCIDYSYSPLNILKSELLKWYKSTINDLSNNKQIMKIKTLYWYLNIYSLKRVKRNDSFIHNMNIQLCDVWDKVLYYRNNEEMYNKDIKSKSKRNTTRNTIPYLPDTNTPMFITDENDECVNNV